MGARDGDEGDAMANILVAEDNKNANKLICTVLRRRGREALDAYDGREALDADALAVVRGTEEVRLPPKEFRLLQFLLQNPGRTYTRMQLLDEIWGWDTESAERTVDVHVNRLRTRFAGWEEFSIETIRGLGYRAVVPGA